MLWEFIFTDFVKWGTPPPGQEEAVEVKEEVENEEEEELEEAEEEEEEKDATFYLNCQNKVHRYKTRVKKIW